MLRQSYKLLEYDSEIMALAERVVELLVNSGLTYQRADNALEAAQEILVTTTKPIKE